MPGLAMSGGNGEEGEAEDEFHGSLEVLCDTKTPYNSFDERSMSGPRISESGKSV